MSDSFGSTGIVSVILVCSIFYEIAVVYRECVEACCCYCLPSMTFCAERIHNVLVYRVIV